MATFVNVDNYAFKLFTAFLLTFYWPGFILIGMHSCKGGWDSMPLSDQEEREHMCVGESSSRGHL